MSKLTIIATIDSDIIDLVEGDENTILAFKAMLPRHADARGYNVEIIDTHESRRTSGLNQGRLVDEDGVTVDVVGGADCVMMAWNAVLNG